MELDRLFDVAGSAPPDRVADRVAEVKVTLRGADQLDQTALHQSIRLELGLRSLVEENSWDGVAVRCWPECFTTFGAACCGPIGSLTNDGVPASCEADALGVATSLLLQEAAGRPAFVADMVSMDIPANTGVFWHCGSAPLSLADPSGPVEAAAHSNRHLPLIHQFGFAPGPLTIARISQSRGGLRLLIGKGEVLAGDRPFAGTCGVVRFESPAEDVLATMMTEGLEHHYVLVAGDVTAALADFAEGAGWDTIDL
jgi:L-fucose isomerase-like protein